MTSPIYLDNAATTKPAPEVVEAVVQAMEVDFANASSIDHIPGAAAAEVVKRAREEAARWLGAQPRELVFTSGATEANNLALLGVSERLDADKEIVVSATEHPSVLETAESLGRLGRVVHVVPTTCDGAIDLDALAGVLSPRTGLVSAMLVNNETGVINPMAEIVDIVREKSDAYLHVDAVQGMYAMPSAIDADLLTLSAHKLHGPKGVGLLYVRRGSKRVRIRSTQRGGSHEHGLRAGTLNVPGIAGFGAAIRLARTGASGDLDHVVSLNDFATRQLGERLPHVEINGGDAPRTPHILSLYLPGVEAAAIVRRLANDVAVSMGSACSTNDVQPSHVLVAMGLEDRAHGTVRMSFGRYTSERDVRDGIDCLIAAYDAVRSNAVR